MRGTIAIATSIISITGQIYRRYLADLSLLIDPIYIAIVLMRGTIASARDLRSFESLVYII